MSSVSYDPAKPLDSGSRQSASEVRSASAQLDLRKYYLVRGLVSVGWAGAALHTGASDPGLAGALLIFYPVWDALANLFDAKRNGGLSRNPMQAANLVISAAIAGAVALAFGHAQIVLGLFGGWAILAGLLQLAVAWRRRRSGGQWPMLLSGGQSALAGAFFIAQALGEVASAASVVAPYAAFGAVYFLISGLWLHFRRGSV